jgi:hypothetical protein
LNTLEIVDSKVEVVEEQRTMDGASCAPVVSNSQAALYTLDGTMLKTLEHELNTCFSIVVGDILDPSNMRRSSSYVGSELKLLTVQSFLDDEHDWHQQDKILFNVNALDMQKCMEHYLSLKQEKGSMSACFLVARGPTGGWKNAIKTMQFAYSFAKGYKNEQGMKFRTNLNVYRDLPKRGRLSAFSEAELNMSFLANLNNQKGVKVVFDSAASHSFINQSFLEANKSYTLKRDGLDVKLGNGKIVQSAGKMNVKLRMQSFSCRVDLHVLDLASDFDIILGDDFLKHYNATLNYETNLVELRKGDKTFVVNKDISYEDTILRKGKGKSIPKSKLPGVLSALQVKRVVRKGPRCVPRHPSWSAS